MKKILVTGSNGQLGLSIKDRSGFYPSFQFIYTDVEELNIADFENLQTYFQNNNVDVVINCAGYTAVDKAETERENAFMINAQGVKNLAILSNEFGFLLVHISTDYIFDGNKTTPYLESDNPNPLSVYGHSKYEGEKEMMKHAKKGIILRTSWLYSEYGNNFVKTIQRLAKERPELKVVSDQTGTPTYSGDLAEIILKMLLLKPDFNHLDIYNYSNEGIASWFDFASAIVELDKINSKVTPIATWDYPLPAKRPQYSVLNKEKIKNEFGLNIPHWKESLVTFLSNVKKGL
jgi:dTDP-4-dehydrorhamnose reductase